jgi:hypothetical protein
MSQALSNMDLLFASPPTEQTSPLWLLPVEIREMIYGQILPFSSTLYPRVSDIFKLISNHEEGRSRKLRTHEKVLALGRTCQSFHTDLIPFYYKTKTLSFSSAYDLYKYLYMIGLYRRKHVRRIDFWLKGAPNHWRVTTQEVYEWACELLSECRSLRRLGIGVSEETRDERMGSGPVKGLEALTGMGLKDLEVKVREVFAWGPQWTGVWDMPYEFEFGHELGLTRFYTREAVNAFEMRLVQNMKSEQGSMGKDEKSEGEDGAQVVNCEIDDPRSAHKKARCKRRASSVTGNRGKKRVKVGTARKGKLEKR